MKDPIRYLGNWTDATLEEVLAYALPIKHVELSTLKQIKEALDG